MILTTHLFFKNFFFFFLIQATNFYVISEKYLKQNAEN